MNKCACDICKEHETYSLEWCRKSIKKANESESYIIGVDLGSGPDQTVYISPQGGKEEV